MKWQLLVSIEDSFKQQGAMGLAGGSDVCPGGRLGWFKGGGET